MSTRNHSSSPRPRYITSVRPRGECPQRSNRTWSRRENCSQHKDSPSTNSDVQRVARGPRQGFKEAPVVEKVTGSKNAGETVCAVTIKKKLGAGQSGLVSYVRYEDSHDESHKDLSLSKNWFFKLSRPVIAGLRRKVTDRCQRDSLASIDNTSSISSLSGSTSAKKHVVLPVCASSKRPEPVNWDPCGVSDNEDTAHAHEKTCDGTDITTSQGDIRRRGTGANDNVGQKRSQQLSVRLPGLEHRGKRKSDASRDSRFRTWVKPGHSDDNEKNKEDYQPLFLLVSLPQEKEKIILVQKSHFEDISVYKSKIVQQQISHGPQQTATEKEKMADTEENQETTQLYVDSNSIAETTGIVLQALPSVNQEHTAESLGPNMGIEQLGEKCRQGKQRANQQPRGRKSRKNPDLFTQSPWSGARREHEPCADESMKRKDWAQTDSTDGLMAYDTLSDPDEANEGSVQEKYCPSLLCTTNSATRRVDGIGLQSMLSLYKCRLEVLQNEKEVLLEMNSAVHTENDALRRLATSLVRGDGHGSSLDVEQNATNGDMPSSEYSLRARLSHGRLPSLATLSRINLRFNREHHGCLHRAVLSGKEEDVEAFLSAGKDINAHDEYGKTPLHCAVGAQKLNIVLCLLSHRPDIDAHDDREDTPLHTAVRTGNIDIVTVILKEGHADPNSVGNAGCSPLHTAAQLEHANNVTLCQLLLKNNAKLLARDHKWMTPLAHAALHASYDVMVCLFLHAKGQGIPKDDLLFEADGLGSTLLYLAVESGSAKVVELCLEEGAAPHSVKTSDGSTPVHLACSYGYMDILDIMMKAVAFILDPPPDQDGMLPVHKAAQSNHHEVIAYLLKQDMDQIDSVDHEGRTPIMLAAENGCIESVRILLDHGANVDIRDSENKTVLHYAIGGIEILKEILKDVKANSLIRAKDRLGNTPLHYASRHGCVKDVSIVLMKYKASAAIVNGVGEIPLHTAARYGWLAVVKKLTEGRGKRTMNANDASERTPLHLAAREGREELVEFFLKRGARIDRDVRGQTPLHYAALQGSRRSLELILDKKPDCLNITDKDQNTALHMAAMGGHSDILKFLLSKPDQIVSVNERNQNILDIAIETKHDAVAMVMADNKRWKEVVRSTVHGTYTQIQLLVRHMPEVAKKFLDRCVQTNGDPEDESYKVSYDLKFIQGMPDEKKKTKNIRESLIALHTMVKYQRLECLTHPLCSVLMDIKWRKFGLVCAFLNQAVYIVYISLVMVMVKYHVDLTKEGLKTDATLNYTKIMDDPLIVTSFRKNNLIAVVAVILIIACVYNLSKECFQIFDEGWKYFFSLNNWLEVTLYVITFVTLVKPRSKDLAEMAVCVFLAWLVLLHYISKFNYVGLYIVMIRKTIKTVFKVLIILVVLLAAFAFAFHVITVPLQVPVAYTRFNEVSTSLAATFFMMLDNLRYEEIVLKYQGSAGSVFVLYSLFIAYCFMMPIIFLNLLIGLAVGDIDSIRKTAAMERYTSQVEHLSQLERALPMFILSKVQVAEYVEYPNRQKNLKDKIVSLLVKLLSPQQEEDEKREDQTYLEERVNRHEAQLMEINSTLKKYSVVLEDLRDLLQDRKRIMKARAGDEVEDLNSTESTEFFV